MLIVTYLLISATLLFSSLSVTFSQPHQLRGNNANRRKRKPSALEAEPFSSIEINYPMHIFDISGDLGDWRSTAVFSTELYDSSDRDKPYLGYARAQDQEDVWLYENWFYGMKGKLVVHSHTYQ